MRHRVTFTHNTRQYRSAVFVPNCTAEEPDRGRPVNTEQAQALTEMHRAQAVFDGGELITSNVYGAWYKDARTQVEETGWGNAARYLQDTPLPITRGTWWYMLEVLPPHNWLDGTAIESFQMSELMAGNVTSTLVRVGNAYWHVYSEVDEPQAKTLQRLSDGIKAQLPASADPDWKPKPLRRLTCACCGAKTQGRQWWNRDTGYGLCDACIPANSVSGADMTQLEDYFGLQGYHFADVVEG